MPGSGKTTVTATLIKILVILNKSVLITSFTNTAVDNILLKLKNDYGIDFIRLASNVFSVHNDILDNVPFISEKDIFSTKSQGKSL